MTPKIAIIGAGLAGQIQAHLFAQQGIGVDVFDSAKRGSGNVPHRAEDLRTTALSPTSVQVLADMGLWSSLKQHAFPVHAMKIGGGKDVVSGLLQSLTLNADDAGRDHLAHIVTNDALQTVVSAALKKTGKGHVSWHWQSECTHIRAMKTGEGARLWLRGKKTPHEYDLIVGCDGARSLVRRLAFDDVGIQSDYKSSAFIALVHHATPHQHVATQIFLPDGPVAFLPVQGLKQTKEDTYISSVIWSAKSDWVRSVIALDRPQLVAFLSQRLGAVLGDIRKIDAVGAYPLRAKLSASFTRQGIALIGDAAHAVHPLAGQGLNLAIGDIVALGQAVSDAWLLGQPIGHSVALEKYDIQRQLAAQKIFTLTDGLSRSFEGHGLPAKALRQFGFGALERVEPLKKYLIHMGLS